MEIQQLKLNVAELEARLFTAEQYINAIVELNKLKQPHGADSELTNQRKKAQKKYMI